MVYQNGQRGVDPQDIVDAAGAAQTRSVDWVFYRPCKCPELDSLWRTVKKADTLWRVYLDHLKRAREGSEGPVRVSSHATANLAELLTTIERYEDSETGVVIKALEAKRLTATESPDGFSVHCTRCKSNVPYPLDYPDDNLRSLRGQ